jgi:glycerophosphoryl diester phosphodiesterase
MKRLLWTIIIFTVRSPDVNEKKPATGNTIMNDHAFLLIAHRGASGELPENTIASFQRALEIYPQCVLEMDVRLSRDGEIIVSHDGSLDRMTNSSKKIKDITLAEIKQLDAGYKKSLDAGKSFPFRGRGYTCPTLSEVLKSFPETRYVIEIKENNQELAEKVISLLYEYKASERVIIGSFHDRVLQIIRKKAPKIITGFGSNEAKRFVFLHKLRLGALYRGNGDALLLPEFSDTENPEYRKDGGNGFRVITKQLIEDAHKKGISVYTWTINSEENMRRLIQWGIDGIITDFPDRLKTVMQEEGIIQ